MIGKGVVVDLITLKASCFSEFLVEKKIPYYNKPDELLLNEWQSSLRKQYAKKIKFLV